MENSVFQFFGFFSFSVLVPELFRNSSGTFGLGKKSAVMMI